jgi:hypothetical protein
MHTAPVPTGVPAAQRAGSGSSSIGGEGLSVPSKGLVGVLSGEDVTSCVPRVMSAFVNRRWVRLILAMCKFVLLPWGEPEFRRGQS